MKMAQGFGSERVRPIRRVLIVDDHASFRDCASAPLNSEGWDVVGEAALERFLE